jgi:hypothetical protein
MIDTQCTLSYRIFEETETILLRNNRREAGKSHNVSRTSSYVQYLHGYAPQLSPSQAQTLTEYQVEAKMEPPLMYIAR